MGPEKLKKQDNILVREHISKAFQPKYKDFCVVGLSGKNQIEIKDNHGHTTKVHHRDVKKIKMTEKICRLYKEEQVGKVRGGRKAVPSSKMPDLGWDIREEIKTQVQTCSKPEEIQELSETEATVPIPLQTMITIAILIAIIWEYIKAHIQEIPGIASKAAQVVRSTTREISRTYFIMNIRKIYRKAAVAITIATNTINHTSHTSHHRAANKNTHKTLGTQKLDDKYDESYQSYMCTTLNDNYNLYS